MTVTDTSSLPQALTDLPDHSIQFVLGTRPEIIKLAPLIRALGAKANLIHTGQHYDENLSQTFLDQFGIGEPDRYLDIGGQSRGSQIGRTVSALDDYLNESKAAAVIVQGDTNSALAGALAANARDVPLVHVEAGLRSFDRAMPEEHNRVLADHVADLCFAPTQQNVDNLRSERIDASRIRCTGNTVVEALSWLRPSDAEVDQMLFERVLRRDQFVLCTFHRPENVDKPESLARVLTALQASPVPVYFPMHPRTLSRLDAIGEIELSNIRIVDPVDYVTFVGLQSAAALIVADSGGVQEEVSILKRALVVVRNSTERPESIGTFASLVRPTEDLAAALDETFQDLPQRLEDLKDVPSPYGDGTATERSVVALAEIL